MAGWLGSRLLGLAVSQYIFGFAGIEVNSRAFYINGYAFARHADDLAEGERPPPSCTSWCIWFFPRESRPFIPPRLNEGLAVYYADQASREALRSLMVEGRLNEVSLPELTGARSLGEHDFLGERVNSEYLYSGAVVQHLIERYGEQALLDFYHSYMNVPDEEVTDEMSGFHITSFGIELSML